MIPLSRAASSTKAELDVRPRDNKTTRRHDWSPVVRRQLPGSPASVDRPNNRQRITATHAPTISAFQRLPRRSSTKAGFSLSGFSTSAFTLIEMTVVLLLILILATFLYTAGSSAIEHARKAQAKNDVTQIVTAVNAFYTEYGKYPVVSTITTDAFYGTLPAGVPIPTGCANAGTNDVLFNILRGTDTTNNPRAIVFLSPSTARNTTPPKGGISQSVGTVGQYMDVWGSPYAILIDSDYNNQIVTTPNPYSDTDGSAGPSPLRLGAIAYSYGKNGQKRGGAAVGAGFVPESATAGKFQSSSDVLSWQ